MSYSKTNQNPTMSSMMYSVVMHIMLATSALSFQQAIKCNYVNRLIGVSYNRCRSANLLNHKLLVVKSGLFDNYHANFIERVCFMICFFFIDQGRASRIRSQSLRSVQSTHSCDDAGELVAKYILQNHSSLPGIEISEYSYSPTMEDLEPDMAAFDPSRADFRYRISHQRTALSEQRVQ